MSQSKVSKIERGALLPTADDVARLCDAYGISAEARTQLIEMAQALREEASSRLVLSRGAASIQHRVAELEATSRMIRAYQPALVLGLLQSERYISYVFGVPVSRTLDPDDLRQAINARRKRQEVLRTASKEFVLIMTEGALRWHVGSPDLMAEQVDLIAETAETCPNVRIGIIPWTQPVQIFPKHGFYLYDNDAVHVANEGAAAIMTGQADVARYMKIMDSLEESAAFGVAAKEHLRRIAADYRALQEPAT